MPVTRTSIINKRRNQMYFKDIESNAAKHAEKMRSLKKDASDRLAVVAKKIKAKKLAKKE